MYSPHEPHAGKHGVEPTPVTTPTQPQYLHTSTFPPRTSLRVVHTYTEPWSTGLCHCCDDPANSLVTFFCPCVTFGYISEIGDKGTETCCSRGAMYAALFLTGFACLYSCSYRSKLRAQYNLEEAPCPDCLVHFCCEGCSLCQEYRELKNRGYDMGIGWEANMERLNAATTIAPGVEGGMTRY